MGLVVNKQQPFCCSQRKYSHQYFLDAHCPPTIYEDYYSIGTWPYEKQYFNQYEMIHHGNEQLSYVCQ